MLGELVQKLKEGQISFGELNRQLNLTSKQKYTIFVELFGETILKELEQDVVCLVEKWADKDLKYVDLADAIEFLIGFHYF